MLHTIQASIMLIIAGCGLLAWAADRFIAGASSLAKNFGVSTLVIGIAVVGFATSLPEMIVSATASFNGNPALGVGNAIGSNIANIGAVIGVTAMICPLLIHSKVLRREFPLLFVIMIFAWALLSNGYLSRLDGVLLVTALVAFLYWLYHITLRGKEKKDPLVVEIEAEPPKKMSTKRAVMWSIVGMLLLLLSSSMLVFGAVNIAKSFGVSELVIGLTVVAFGTSLPELAASLAGALKGEPDIAVGNVIGSNMFNLLGVLAMPGLIHPAPVASVVIFQDFPIMLGFTILLYLFAFGIRKQGRINRFEGLVLFIGYISYLVWLY